jgi:hypothetical protein
MTSATNLCDLETPPLSLRGAQRDVALLRASCTSGIGLSLSALTSPVMRPVKCSRAHGSLTTGEPAKLVARTFEFSAEPIRACV